MGEEVHRLLTSMICDLRADNKSDHERISSMLDKLSDEVDQLRMYRSKVAGFAAGVSAAVSVAAWGVTKAFGG